MDPNPYESPSESSLPAPRKQVQHPLTRIAVLFVLAIATMLAIGVVHAMLVEIFIFAPARKRGTLR